VTKLSAGAIALACLLPPAAPALGQPAQAPAAAGVTAYPAAFFAQYQSGNAREMLERVPGLQLDYGSGVRGFDGAAGNVLIDGERPASKSDFLGDILARIPVGKVERIDLIRGGAPGIDMQGKAVIAIVILKKDATVRAKLQVDGYSLADGRQLGGLRFESSGGGGARTWEVSGFHLRGFAGQLDTGVATTAPPGRPATQARIDVEDDGWLDQITAAASWPLAGGKLRVNGLAYHDDLKFEEDDTDTATGVDTSTDQLTRDTSRELGGNYTRALSAKATVELVGLYRTDDTGLTSAFRAPGGDQRFDLDREGRETIARGALKYAAAKTLSFEAGGEAAHNRLDSLTGFTANGVVIPIPAADVLVTEDRSEVFGKGSWRPTAQWTIDGQLRYERSTVKSSGDVRLRKTLQYAKPRLALTWAANPENQVRLRLERFVGQLSFDDFVAQASLNTATGVTAGNPDLEPERSWIFEAVYDRRFWGRGAIVLTARHTEVQGVVDRGPVFTPTGVFDTPTNIGDGRRELAKADLTLPLDKLGVKGGLLKSVVVVQWSEVRDPTTGEQRRISGDRPVGWNATLSQDLPKQNLTYGVFVDGGGQQRFYRFNAIDAAKVEAFVELFVEWRPRKDLNLRAELSNLTERGARRTTLTYPGPRNAGGAPTLSDRDAQFGRSVYIRLQKSFGG
jgi:outer membrane receptor protein involved in Fe transport